MFIKLKRGGEKMDKVIDFLISIGLEVPIIAIATVILTGVLKMPIKILADKASSPKKITRFITLLPIVLGFGLTVLFEFAESGTVNFNDGFYNTWLSSVSLSLAMYAILEQFLPSEKKILSKAEIDATKTVIKEIASKLVVKQQDSIEETSIKEDQKQETQ